MAECKALVAPTKKEITEDDILKYKNGLKDALDCYSSQKEAETA